MLGLNVWQPGFWLVSWLESEPCQYGDCPFTTTRPAPVSDTPDVSGTEYECLREPWTVMSNEKRRGLISTALAVLQPLALSWVAVVILAVLSYVLAASSPMLGDAPWQDAARLGSSVWLLALGGPLSVDGGTVGLIPLVVTACIWLLCRHFMRGAPIFDWVDVAAGTAAAGVTAGLLGLFALPGSFRLGGILGAMLIVAVCALASWWRHEPPEHRAWLVVRECWRMLWPMLAGIVLMALVGVVVAVVLGWDTIVEINSYYVLGTVGTISLSFVQLLYLPNLVVWAVAYISGAGFAVGSGSSFSSLSVTAAPLPALPVLGRSLNLECPFRGSLPFRFCWGLRMDCGEPRTLGPCVSLRPMVWGQPDSSCCCWR